MQRDCDVGDADRLDRLVQLDLAAGDREALCCQQVGNVAGGNRTVELAGFACRADDNKVFAVQLFSDLLGFGLALQIAGLELSALALEFLLVGLVGAQRLALRQEEIAGKAVLDLDRFAHLTEAGNAFEKNNFHLFVPSMKPESRRLSLYSHDLLYDQALEQVRKQVGLGPCRCPACPAVRGWLIPKTFTAFR